MVNSIEIFQFEANPVRFIRELPGGDHFQQLTNNAGLCGAHEALPETLRARRESSIVVIACRRDRMFAPIRSLEI
jgi:hypothetical protein